MYRCTLPDLRIGKCAAALGWCVNLDMEVQGVVFGYSPAVCTGETADSALIRIDSDLALTGEEVDDQARGLVAGEIHPHYRSPLGRSQFDGCAIAAQFSAEIMRSHDRLFEAKGGGALPGGQEAPTALRTEQEVAVVADPGTGLVRSADAVDLAGRGSEKARSLLGLWSPVGHGEGTGNQR